jgi:hypothetical protein
LLERFAGTVARTLESELTRILFFIFYSGYIQTYSRRRPSPLAL